MSEGGQLKSDYLHSNLNSASFGGQGPPDQPFYVYTLTCHDNKYYTGCTKHLDERLARHQRGSVPATKERRAVESASYRFLLRFSFYIIPQSFYPGYLRVPELTRSQSSYLMCDHTECSQGIRKTIITVNYLSSLKIGIDFISAYLGKVQTKEDQHTHQVI